MHGAFWGYQATQRCSCAIGASVHVAVGSCTESACTEDIFQEAQIRPLQLTADHRSALARLENGTLFQ